MATATKNSHAAKQFAGRASAVRVPGSMEFLIFEDNGGDYHWTIVARDGARPVDLSARRDDADAERWLDEGGSFSSKAVAKWPAPR